MTPLESASQEISPLREPQNPPAWDGVPTTPHPQPLQARAATLETQVPLSPLGWERCPCTPQAAAARALGSPYLRPVELQIWVLLPFQVSIAQETAVLKHTAPQQACYQTDLPPLGAHISVSPPPFPARLQAGHPLHLTDTQRVTPRRGTRSSGVCTTCSKPPPVPAWGGVGGQTIQCPSRHPGSPTVPTCS